MTSVLLALACQTTLVRTHVDGKPRVETTRLCVDTESRPTAQPEPGFVISENCTKGTCLALKASSDLLSTTGATTNVFANRFKLCAEKGGRPEVIEFQWNGRWQPSDRCVFEKDHSFVDTLSFVGSGRFEAGKMASPKITKPLQPHRRTEPAGNTAGPDRKR
ncbi:MAG: hypothetical protein V4760_13165 [Bdellovibrionota bacterium]